MGINAILMKYFFEDMFNICLKDYIKMNGETEELKGEKKKKLKKNIWKYYIRNLYQKIS